MHRYHAGEVRVQERAGVRETALKREGGISPEMPTRAQLFLQERRMVVLGTSDPEDRPWASVLIGDPGFAQAADPKTIRISAEATSGDPLAANLDSALFAGLTAVDFTRRMRLRVNGRLDRTAEGAILIRVDQVYSNCVKYVQARQHDPDEPRTTPSLASRSRTLTEAQRKWIRCADTFFIATANPGEGADASHRGGMPGFIEVEEMRLTWPDYAGNSMFCTMGNLEIHPRAGLLFLDFESGSTLQVTGRASVDWDPGRAAAVPGAERLINLDVEEAVEIHGALPLRLRLLEYSPFNPELTSAPRGPR